MALNVEITGGGNIAQGARVSLTAVVTDADGNASPGILQYAWSASRGTFIGDTDEETAVYHADFMDTGDVNVTITCNVTRAANANPTVSGPSLTALAEIGVTGILVNMFMTALGAVAPNSNSALYNASTGTLAAGSDQRLSSNIFVYQLRWDNTNNNFVLNNNEGGDLGNFFVGNDDQSVFIIFPDGTYEELPRSAFDGGTSHGNVWARWLVSDSSILTLLNGLSTTDDLVVGVADTGSIGWGADAGSDTETFTAAVPVPLGIESINEQFITIGTEDYDLVIDITGNPDTAKATGHMEGFGQDWDAVNGQLHIKSEEVTRLISGVNWNIEVVKDMQTLMGQIAYNVIAAAPIFATLETIHLYRGVPINFDILIQNIPPLLIPDSELLGLKSELLEYGINVQGQISTTDRYSFNSGNVTIIVPSEGGGADTVYNYPYEIETGTPPTISGVEFRAHGDYGDLTFPDVTHALGYEWTLDTGEDPTWNFFDTSRQIINPGEIELIPGHLNVTVKFPNVPGASSYEYQLVTEEGEGFWTRFTGILANGMITTIIPNLQEDVEYTLRLRVASPWVGTPVSVTVFGGRTCYTLQIDNNDRDNQWLYLYHTGHRSGEHASRIKRFLLPTSMTHLDLGGLAVDRDGNVYIIQSGNTGAIEKALYTFNRSTIDSAADGSRLTQDMKNPFPSAIGTSLVFRGMDFYGGNLYMDIRTAPVDWMGVQVFPIPTTDGAALTRTTSGNRPLSTPHHLGDVSVTDESLFYRKSTQLWHVDRELLTGDTRLIIYQSNAVNQAPLTNFGFDVIDEDYVYVQSTTQLLLYRVNPEIHETRHVLDFLLELPAGLTNPKFLSVSE